MKGFWSLPERPLEVLAVAPSAPPPEERIVVQTGISSKLVSNTSRPDWYLIPIVQTGIVQTGIFQPASERRENNFKRVPESQGQKPALAVFCVPYVLDTGWSRRAGKYYTHFCSCDGTG